MRLYVFSQNHPLAAATLRRGLWHLTMLMLVLTVFREAAEARMLPTPGSYCEEAIEAAAYANRIPTRLMKAVGVVETGRQDPTTGVWRPWPWAINAEGNSFFFSTKTEAILAARTLQAAGVRSIDVGCMQVNLLHHPDAFATLDEAFDPKRNANYAGRFLSQLFRRSGDWMIAAGWYHSTTSELAAEYTKRILAYLPGKKLIIPEIQGSSKLMAIKDFAPRVGRDGMIVPSTRLTRLGFIASRAVNHDVSARAGQGPLF